MSERAEQQIQPLRLLSLCSGIGGIDLPWSYWLGQEIAAQVEIDDFCRAVLSKHWPDVPRARDIRDVQGDEYGRIDVVAGGIPCQGNSIVGRRRGRADERYLWPETARIVCTAQPRWVVVENVAGMRSVDSGGLFADVLGDLAALGYSVGWLSVEAADVGAPHKRERVFVVAHASSVGTERERSAMDSANRSHTAREGHTYWDAAQHRSARARHVERQAQSRLGRAIDGLSGWLDFPGWPALPNEPQHDWEAPRTIARGDAHRAARVKALGNAIVPQQIYPLLRAIVETESGVA